MPDEQKLLDTYFAKRAVLLRFLTGLTRDAAVAEDILQDLYLKIVKAKPSSQIDDPLSFLFKAANNLFLNGLRAKASQRARDSAWHAIRSRVSGVSSLSDADDAPDAETIISGRQTLAAVLKALKTLPELTQSIVRLHKFEGLSQVEVAHRLDISVSSVEKHLSRALKLLINAKPPPN